MKFVRWAATGLGVGVVSGFMGGLLRARAAGSEVPQPPLRKA
jgi:hypothetical protein